MAAISKDSSELFANTEPEHHFPKLSGDLSITYIKKSGFLTKEGEKVHSWKRRLFELEGTVLFYFDEENVMEPYPMG